MATVIADTGVLGGSSGRPPAPTEAGTDALPRFAARAVAAVSVVLTALLVVVSARYGYGRDELYFLACGRHLAWGYPDQPPFVPLVARVATAVAPGSLLVLRLPAAIAAGTTVVLTGLICREVGGARRAQLLAAAAIAVSSLVLATGHLLSTTTFLLTATAALVLLALRALRTGDGRWWLGFGLVTGVGLLDTDLVAFVAAAVAVGVLLVGPRRSVMSWHGCAGAVVAVLLWAPYLVWQARHGWPQLTVARAISHGGSGTSTPRWQIPVMQLVLCSPPLVPIWVAGLIRLFRGRDIRWARALGVAYVVLLLVFMVTGGKPYYLAVTFPLLVGAGAPAVVSWAGDGTRRGDGRRHGTPGRRALLVAAVVVAAVPDAFIALPLVSASAIYRTPIVAVNYDAGETIGWPTYVRQVAGVVAGLPDLERPQVVILTRNYGEAGAIDRYGRALGLPKAHSGHDAYWLWGPPPEGQGPVVAVGYDRTHLDAMFAEVTLATRLHNSVHLDNDEQDEPVWVCRGPRGSFAALWPRVKRYG